MSAADRLTDEALIEQVAKMLAGPTGAAHHESVPAADGVPVTLVRTADLVALRDALAARPAPDTLAAHVQAQAKADALRSQRDFFLSVDMPAAADHCEEAAVEWESARDDADRALLAGRPDGSPEGGGK